MARAQHRDRINFQRQGQVAQEWRNQFTLPGHYDHSCCYTSLPTPGFLRLGFCQFKVRCETVPIVVLICISRLLVKLSIFSWVSWTFEFQDTGTLEMRVPLLGLANSSFYPPLFFHLLECFSLHVQILFASYMCCNFHGPVGGVSSFYVLINIPACRLDWPLWQEVDDFNIVQFIHSSSWFVLFWLC